MRNPVSAMPLRHGYSMQEIDLLVRRGLTRNPWYKDVDSDERYATGWHAAITHLYTAHEAPEPGDLVRAAWRAADEMTRTHLIASGIPRHRSDGYAARTDLPHFHAYWQTISQPHLSPEGAVVASVALRQIWPQLGPLHQAALMALAAHGDYQAAADSLGLKYRTFCEHVRLARLAFLRLWLEGETPRRGWRDRRSHVAEVRRRSPSAYIRRRARAGVA